MTDLFRFLNSVEDSFLGYDRAFRQLENAATYSNQQRGYPPFNIMRNGEMYRIELAIAGFNEDEIDVHYENGELTIKGDKTPQDQEGQEIIHQGIAYRKFIRKFHLASTIEIDGASLIDGILTIYLKNVLPEHLQPRKIEVRKERLDTEKQQLLNE